MRIKELIINQNENKVFDYHFKNDLNLLNNELYIIDAILCVTGRVVAIPHDDDYSFSAKVVMEDTYRVCGRKSKDKYFWSVQVSKENNELDCTDEFFERLLSNKEMDELSYFHRYKYKEFPKRLEKYKDVPTYYPEGEFARLTDGYGSTRSFRGFVTQYIKHFKPKRLREDRGLFLNVLPSGRFVVNDISSDKEVKNLSSGEKLLYHYYSFMALADFWGRAERIRNMNHVDKPIIVEEFLELLDESIDVSYILRQTKNIGRQVIMFAPSNQLTIDF